MSIYNCEAQIWKVDINDHNVFMILIAPKALQVINKWRQTSNQSEACGVLLGEIRNTSIKITNVSTPQPSDERFPTKYIRHIKGHQELVDDLHSKSNGTVNYVGEWHTHPENIPSPSSTDLESWKNTSTFFSLVDIPLVFFIAGIQGDWLGIMIKNTLYKAKRMF